MAYTPTVWVDNTTPVNATNLNHLEDGVDDAHDDIAALDVRVVDLEDNPQIPEPVVNGQWIKGVGGVPVWSAIAIADVTSLQASLDAKVDDSEKAAINGVATLDSAGRVVQSATVDKIYSVGQVDGYIPIVRTGVTVWEPPPAGGADLVYNGSYPTATPYTDGDIVIHNGIAYMCVRATSAAPTPWPGVGAAGSPPGVVLSFAGSVAPTGWLLTIGQTVSRTTYAALFAVIGTTYNTGGEAGTDFRLPDLQGRMIVGKGTNADVDTLGESDGAVLADRRPKHKHSVSMGLAGTTHAANRGGGSFGASDGGTANTQHSHSLTVGPTANVPTDTPAYLVLNYIIAT